MEGRAIHKGLLVTLDAALLRRVVDWVLDARVLRNAQAKSVINRGTRSKR